MEGSTLKATVGRSTANAPVKAVLDIIQSPEKKSLWDKLYKSGYTLETLNDASGKYPFFCSGLELFGIVIHFSFTEIVYNEYKSIFPTSARDFVNIQVCVNLSIILCIKYIIHFSR